MEAQRPQSLHLRQRDIGAPSKSSWRVTVRQLESMLRLSVSFACLQSIMRYVEYFKCSVGWTKKQPWKPTYYLNEFGLDLCTFSPLNLEPPSQYLKLPHLSQTKSQITLLPCLIQNFRLPLFHQPKTVRHTLSWDLHSSVSAFYIVMLICILAGLCWVFLGQGKWAEQLITFLEVKDFIM